MMYYYVDRLVRLSSFACSWRSIEASPHLMRGFDCAILCHSYWCALNTIWFLIFPFRDWCILIGARVRPGAYPVAPGGHTALLPPDVRHHTQRSPWAAIERGEGHRLRPGSTPRPEPPGGFPLGAMGPFWLLLSRFFPLSFLYVYY